MACGLNVLEVTIKKEILTYIFYFKCPDSMICILLTAHCCHYQVTVSITSGRTVVIGPVVVGQLLQGHKTEFIIELVSYRSV